MDISRRTVGLVMLVTGLALIASYLFILDTSVGSVAELLGVGFCFTILGLLTTLGELVGIAPEDDR